MNTGRVDDLHPLVTLVVIALALLAIGVGARLVRTSTSPTPCREGVPSQLGMCSPDARVDVVDRQIICRCPLP